MNIAIINKSDLRGGAAVVSSRLAMALQDRGHNVSMLVCEKIGAENNTILAAPRWRALIPFLAERLKIFIQNGLNRSSLFKIDTASDGLPLHRLPAVRNADLILLNWTNQGMLSLSGLRKLLQLGKPVVVTMHDMWAFTGICHHAGTCKEYLQECCNCPLLNRPGACRSLAHRVWRKKNNVYNTAHHNLFFVAVSNWLAQCARNSSLLASQKIFTIPNLFNIPTPASAPLIPKSDNEFRIIFGAARIDDPIKDHLCLIQTMQSLSARYPQIADKVHLISFGSLKNPEALNGIPVKHSHLGPVPAGSIPAVYKDADVILSTSLYETLPGTLVEGQALGAVPVATNHGGQADIVTHLQTGFLAPWSDNRNERADSLADGIAWVYSELSNPTSAANLRNAMRNSVKTRFNPDTITRSYLQFLK